MNTNPDNHPSAGLVLLIEDDADVIDTLREALELAHYRVAVASSARQAFSDIFKTPPDIIILDINLPDLDGFHVAKELKRNMMFRHIPVILLSGRLDFLEKMRSLDVIVDEYLVKPVDIQDLILRTRMVLQRAQQNLDANPLTRLPGNTAIVAALKAKITEGKPYAVGYADLNNFKAYNDKYGFSNGDNVIRAAAQIIVTAVQKFSPDDNFVGHIGGDDFMFICSYDAATDICQEITEAFDKAAPGFYSQEDRDKGYILVEDRRGIVSQFPFLSIAIGMASDEGKKFANLGQINHSLTQLKKYAKSFQGSAFVRDRRSLAAQMAEFTWGPGSAAGSSKILEGITAAVGNVLPAQLDEVLRAAGVSVLFQPILDMKTDEVVGHESLVRGPVGTPLEFPDALFQTARTAGKVVDLDMLCLKKILTASEELHRGVKLFVNVFPETILEEKRLHGEILGDPRRGRVDLIFELSGSNRASDASELFVGLRRLKERGLKICMDANVALLGHGLKFLPELRPDFIKLNMMHFKDMVHDYQKQEDFIRTVHLVHHAGSQVICTKLESRSDSFLAVKAGVNLGQGFLFARPSHPPARAA